MSEVPKPAATAEYLSVDVIITQLKQFADRIGGDDFVYGASDGVGLARIVESQHMQSETTTTFRAKRIRPSKEQLMHGGRYATEFYRYLLESQVKTSLKLTDLPESVIDELVTDYGEEILSDDEVSYHRVERVTLSIASNARTFDRNETVSFYMGDGFDEHLITVLSADVYEVADTEDNDEVGPSTLNPSAVEMIEDETTRDLFNRLFIDMVYDDRGDARIEVVDEQECANRALGLLAIVKAGLFPKRRKAKASREGANQ
ncbi:hypothetical protein CYG49_04110 [Candidatus Saccharibacteria bacterium]|nr:MAG: hypothetical protein CYG49_04110 [Candidatus Saccharibacteria bacterium]